VSAQGVSVLPTGAKRIGMMILITVLLVLIVFSARAGVSYVVQYRTHAALDHWQKSPDKRPTLNAWQGMLDSVKEMLAFDAKNADLQNALARLYFYRAGNMDSSAKQSLQDYKQAIAGYRTVIALRPSWPYGYLNLLYNKVFVGELDAEMRDSLLHLIQLSPWEKNTLSDTVKVAVFVWPGLDKQSQQAVKSYLLLTSEKRKGEVVRALKESQLKDRFCQQIARGQAMSVCR